MSDQPTCPYCGAPISSQPSGEYDQSIRMRCPNCRGVFEYIPGFGTFSLSDEERQSGAAGPFPGMRPSAGGAGGFSTEPQPECNACAAVGLVLCCIAVSLIPFLFFWLLG